MQRRARLTRWVIVRATRRKRVGAEKRDRSSTSMSRRGHQPTRPLNAVGGRSSHSGLEGVDAQHDTIGVAALGAGCAHRGPSRPRRRPLPADAARLRIEIPGRDRGRRTGEPANVSAGQGAPPRSVPGEGSHAECRAPDRTGHDREQAGRDAHSTADLRIRMQAAGHRRGRRRAVDDTVRLACRVVRPGSATETSGDVRCRGSPRGIRGSGRRCLRSR